MAIKSSFHKHCLICFFSLKAHNIQKTNTELECQKVSKAMFLIKHVKSLPLLMFIFQLSSTLDLEPISWNTPDNVVLVHSHCIAGTHDRTDTEPSVQVKN